MSLEMSLVVFNASGLAEERAPSTQRRPPRSRSCRHLKHAAVLRLRLRQSARLSPGRYDWQVTVIDPAGHKAAFWQAAVAIVP
jgi:hypothetical protein